MSIIQEEIIAIQGKDNFSESAFAPDENDSQISEESHQSDEFGSRKLYEQLCKDIGFKIGHTVCFNLKGMGIPFCSDFPKEKCSKCKNGKQDECMNMYHHTPEWARKKCKAYKCNASNPNYKPTIDCYYCKQGRCNKHFANEAETNAKETLDIKTVLKSNKWAKAVDSTIKEIVPDKEKAEKMPVELTSETLSDIVPPTDIVPLLKASEPIAIKEKTDKPELSKIVINGVIIYFPKGNKPNVSIDEDGNPVIIIA